MGPPGYYRYPTIHGDRVAFVSEDDLWTVPASGGEARRMTSGVGMASHPSWSPDGRSLAFTGSEEGIREVYVVGAQGGEVRRLTYLADDAFVAGWTPRGDEIVFASAAGQPFRFFWLQAVGVSGGGTRALPTGPARSISYGAGGSVVIGRFQEDPARWKRYRGGTAGTLWIDRDGSGRFQPFLSHMAGNLVRPMWIGDRIWFLSDHEGIGNLYSALPTGEDIRRHTDHEDHYARHPSTDGVRIVYHAGADLRILDPATGQGAKIEVDYPSQRTQTQRKFVRASRYLETASLHPKGHSVALTIRGKVFAMGNWEGPAVGIGAQEGVRLRLAKYLPDGERLVLVSDRSGEEAFEVHATSEPKPPVRFEGLDTGRPVAMTVRPTGEGIAFTNHRHEVLVLDLVTGELVPIERSPHKPITDIAWSPDGQWLAYAFPESEGCSSIRLYHLPTRRIVPVTGHRYRDASPSFDPEGKHLYFLSHREFDPVYDAMFFDLGFPRGVKPYLVTLRRDLPNPFVPDPRPLIREKEKDKDKEKPKDAPEGPDAKAIRIDLEDIGDRVVPFPMPEARYGRIVGIRGKALLTRFPIEGSLGRSWADDREPPANGTLLAYDFDKQTVTTLLKSVTAFSVDLDGKTLLYRAGWKIRVIKAGEKAPEGAKEAMEGPGAERQTGWVDLGRPAVQVVPREEWRQMFREAWRLMRDHFWVQDMSGVDWKAIHDRYLPLIDRVGCRSEFSDLVWEMQGELGTSHAYEAGGDYRPAPRYPIGQLAADLEYDAAAGGYRVVRIVRGEPGDPRRSSPLVGPGLDIAVGDVLESIGTTPLGPSVSPAQILVHQADREVRLAFRSPDEAKGRRVVTVRTLAEERSARYRDWVLTNRERVHQATGGRAGYVHIPNMGPSGYAEFHRDYLSEVGRPSLVVDVRYNGGGHVSQLILEKLARRRLGYDVSRWGTPSPYPGDSILGPMVALTNEHAGSDGDIFSHCFKLLGIGLLIGKRTWGGVIGIWPRHRLADGSVTTQPEFSFWFQDVGFGIENRGTDPDVEVEIAPQDHVAGRDPQLDAAIESIERLLREGTTSLPDFASRPRLDLPRLPPRA